MKAFARIFLTVILTGLGFGVAIAAQPSDNQKQELVQLVQKMNEATAKKDISLIVDNMPERLYNEMAIRMHAKVPELRESLRVQVQSQFDKIKTGGYALDDGAIQYSETKDGTFYAMVPTRVETDTNVMEYMTLALYDQDKWHLIYGGQKTMQNSIFQEIYPSFVNVMMPMPKVMDVENGKTEPSVDEASGK